MCSISMALMGLTTGLQVAGQYQQSRAQAAAYTAQAEAAEQNARIQNRKSEQIAENAAAEQRKLDNRMRLIAGQQAATAGASGIVGGVGSSLDIYNASMDAWKEDSVNLLNNQRNAVYDNYTQEVNFRNQGNSYRAQASAAKQAGNMAIAGTLLGAASSMIGGASSGGGNTSSGAVYAAPDSISIGTSAVKKINAFNNAYSGWGTANLYNPGSFKVNGGIGV